MLRRAFLAACAACGLVCTTAQAGDKGFFGLSLTVEIGGTPAAPLVNEAKVIKVLTASPAENAGIQRGDVIVEVEGLAVPGPADEFRKRMQKEVGQALRLKLKRGNAEPYDVTLVAAVGRPE